MENQVFEPADIAIYIQGKGMVLKEKSLVAIDMKNNKIVAYGTDAEQMSESLTECIIMSPLRYGMIADFTVAASLFKALLKKAYGKSFLCRRPICIFVSKGNITEVEKKAIEDVIYQAGASEVLIGNRSQEQFLNQKTKEFFQIYAKYKTIIFITKDNPENYITEQFKQILRYTIEVKLLTEHVTQLLHGALSEKFVEAENTNDWYKVPAKPADIVIYKKDKGIVLKEKSLVAFDKVSNKIVAYGTDAERMMTAFDKNIEVVSPLRAGIVDDYILAVNLFKYLITKALGKNSFRKLSTIICVHKSTTGVEKKAIFDMFYQNRIKKVMLCELNMPLEKIMNELSEKYPKEYKEYNITYQKLCPLTSDKSRVLCGVHRLAEAELASGNITYQKLCPLTSDKSRVLCGVHRLAEAELASGNIIIDITKEEPEQYIIEEFDQIIHYARQSRISDDKIIEIWKDLSDFK